MKFYLLAWAFMTCLMAQEQAALSFSKEDPYRDITNLEALEAHYEAVYQKAIELYYNNDKPLPEGVERQRRSLVIRGRIVPEMVRVHDCLSVFIGLFRIDESGERQQLLIRGFNPEDFPAIEKWAQDGETVSRFMSEKTDSWTRRFLKNRRSGTLTRSDVRIFLEEKRKVRNQAEIEWTRDVFSNVSDHSRRVLVSYLRERFIPNVGYDVGILDDETVGAVLEYLETLVSQQGGER